jgi:hypothetical protein
MNYADKLETGLSYDEFLSRYGSDTDRERWRAFHQAVRLTDGQRALLRSFERDMKVLVMAGAWCGDCVNQCPIFDHFAAASDRIHLRFFDRDDHPDLASELQTCGAPRVPAVVFLSEDGYFCGRAGDRTLAKYRQLASSVTGAACSTGIADSVTDAVVQEWLNEFERIQWMLRTSGRLRKLHGD